MHFIDVLVDRCLLFNKLGKYLKILSWTLLLVLYDQNDWKRLIYVLVLAI